MMVTNRLYPHIRKRTKLTGGYRCKKSIHRRGTRHSRALLAAAAALLSLRGSGSLSASHTTWHPGASRAVLAILESIRLI